MIAIDFETYYDSQECSVKLLGPEAYTRHHEYDCYMVSMYGDGVEYVGPPESAPWHTLDNEHWCAHNSQFDGWVVARLREQGRIPEVYPASPIVDTAAIPAYCQVQRNLKSAAAFMLDKAVDKNIRSRMSGKHWKDVKPDLQESMKRYALNDAKLCLELLESHGHKLPDHEWELSDLTIKAADTGIKINTEQLEKDHAHLLQVRDELLAQIPWAGGELKGAMSVGSFRKQVAADHIEGMPTTTNQTNPAWNEWFAEHAPKHPYIAAFKDLGRLNKHFATIDTIRRRVSPEGFLYYSFKYCGAAATRRWSGGQEGDIGRMKDSALNLQNLTKPDYFGVSVRPLFTARPGYKLLTIDLSQIEPRCLAWVTGDKAFLDQVRNGVDVYEAHARATMGYNDERPLKEGNPDMRQVAKIRVLQLGYGSGPIGYSRFANSIGMNISQADAKRAVFNYRNQNPHIVKFWNQLESHLQSNLGGDVEIELPTGSVINYFDVRKEAFQKYGKPSVGLRCTVEKGSSERVEYWGSKLAENFIQHLARDVFAYKLLQLDRAGFRILFHVHDEATLEIPEDSAEEALQEITQIMKSDDERLPGLPIGAAGEISDYYAK